MGSFFCDLDEDPPQVGRNNMILIFVRDLISLASDFAFSYSDVLGLHRDYKIKMGEFQEGWMIVFQQD